VFFGNVFEANADLTKKKGHKIEIEKSHFMGRSGDSPGKAGKKKSCFASPSDQTSHLGGEEVKPRKKKRAYKKHLEREKKANKKITKTIVPKRKNHATNKGSFLSKGRTELGRTFGVSSENRKKNNKGGQKGGPKKR